MFKNNLSSRIRAFALIPTLTVALILTFIFLFSRFNHIDRWIEEKALNIIQPLAIVTEPAIKENKKQLITVLINRVHRKYSGFIKSIAMFDKNNELITTSNFYKNLNTLKIQSLYQLPVVPQIYHVNDKVLFYAPVYNSVYTPQESDSDTPPDAVPLKNLLGYISIELNTDSFTLLKYQQVVLVFSILLLGYLIAKLIGQKLMHDISRPINNMIEVIDLIRQGHLDARISGNLLGELNALKKGINAMAISLGDFHLEMQQNVEQTTSDLRETLEQLEIQNIELDIAKKRAQEAVRIKSEFLANMTHELRTPLNGIIGFTQQMMKTNLTPNQLDYLKTIEKSGGNLLSIINDILDFSRLESGRLTLENILFDFEKMIDEVVRFQAPIAHEKGIEITIDIQKNLPHSLVGDPMRIQRIITNLVGNAIKFTSQGNIDIKASLIQLKDNVAEIEISVKDQGIGISKSQQNIIFQAFQQADTSTSRSYGGTGLGLVISQKLVERMQGTIGVSSQLNKGSNFYFTVKLPVGKITLENETPAIKLRQKRVLLIENNKLTAQIQKEILEEMEIEVTSVTELDNADLQRHFDCAIIGISADSPDIDLTKLTESIRKIKQKTPNILVSLPSTELLLAEKLYGIGVTSCLDRPISRHRLLKITSELLTQNKPMIVLPDDAKKTVKHLSNFDIHVLAVDDNPANLKLITALLGDLITHVDSASDGAQAISLAHKQKYDLIFMDIQMPIMDGIKTTKEIREDRLNKETPVIAVTAHTMDEDKKRLFSMGMSDYLAKPISEKQLIRLINKWGNHSDSLAESIPEHQLQKKKTKQKSIDWSVALRQSANKEDLAKEMLQMLIDSFAEIKKAIECSFEDESILLVDIVHKLHGSCAYSGVPVLKNLCYRVESALRSGKKEKDLEPELLEILDEMDHITQDAPHYLEQNA